MFLKILYAALWTTHPRSGKFKAGRKATWDLPKDLDGTSRETASMLEGLFKHLKKAPGPAPESQRFGALEINPALGMAALEVVRHTRHVGPIRDQLCSLEFEQKNQLVDGLILRLALYVHDLQASERQHHSRPYGLLSHSLEVAEEVVRRISGPRIEISIDYGTNHREKPRWVYGGFVLALLHDLGKVFDLEVRLPDGKDTWDPMVEPLALFCERNHLQGTGAKFWAYHRGRGLAGHAWHGLPLLSLLLPPLAAPYLGRRLLLLMDAMIYGSMGAKPTHVPAYAYEIAKVIAEVDVELSRADRLRSKASAAPAGEPEGKSGKAPGSGAGGKLTAGQLCSTLRSTLEEAVQEGLIPLNLPGGVYVDASALYLEYPETFRQVLELLPGGLGEQAKAGAEEGIERGFRDWVLEALAGGGLLPLAAKSGRKVEAARIESWTSRAFASPVVLLDRGLGQPDLPLFNGIIRVQGNEPAAKEAPKADTVHRGRENPAPSSPPAPWRVGGRTPPTALEEGSPAGTSSNPAPSYGRRVEVELRDHVLMDMIDEGINSGFLQRNHILGDVFLRPDFFWFKFPGSLEKLFRRKGIAYTARIGARVLWLIGLWERAAGNGGGCGPEEVRFHPESPQPDKAFYLPADSMSLGAPYGAAFETWPHPVLSAGSPPALGGPEKERLREEDQASRNLLERNSPEGLQLQRFTRIYESIWDLCSLQAGIRNRLIQMNEEFRQRIPKSRLVLHLKRKDSSHDFYALFWGHTIPTPGMEGPREGKKPKKWIDHLPGPLENAWINAWGHRARRATYFDFDRRRLALNEAYGGVTQALTTSLFVLRGHYEKRENNCDPPPLPPFPVLQDLSPQGRECMDLAWRLVSWLMEGETALERVSRATWKGPASKYLSAQFHPCTTEEHLADSCWVVQGQGRVAPLTYRLLRTLHLPLKLIPEVFSVEKERRRIMEDYEEHASQFCRIRLLSREAREAAVERLAESGRVLVDEYDNPIAALSEQGSGPRVAEQRD